MSVPDILQKIVAAKQRTLLACKQQVPLITLQRQLTDYTVRDFISALRHKQPGVIAEIKRASPSQGIIRDPFEPTVIAQQYATAGAACLSVLTEQQFFLGDPSHLQQARTHCDLPILRKDFIIDPYQIYESRALGADCVLLIVAILDDATLQQLHDLAHELGMAVLLESHTLPELERALRLSSPLIGINNRNLSTFTTHLSTTIQLLPHIPNNRLVITESGIHRPDDVASLQQHGVNCFLVGEALMRAKDPGEQLKKLFF